MPKNDQHVNVRWSELTQVQTYCRTKWFRMISILRVFVESSTNTKEAIKQRSRNRACIYEKNEVDFSASERSLGGVLEAAWRHLEASWRRHEKAKARLMVWGRHRLGDLCDFVILGGVPELVQNSSPLRSRPEKKKIIDLVDEVWLTKNVILTIVDFENERLLWFRE